MAEGETDPPLDKSGWPSGPWEGEPDRLEWRLDDCALPLLIQRGPLGVLCGYVGVPPWHPAYGKDYDGVDVDVHGGLNYAERCQRHICHVPRPGESDDVWWLGFDCAHAWDLIPTLAKYSATLCSDCTYRDIAYVKAEVESLARQLVALVEGKADHG